MVPHYIEIIDQLNKELDDVKKENGELRKFINEFSDQGYYSNKTSQRDLIKILDEWVYYSKKIMQKLESEE